MSKRKIQIRAIESTLELDVSKLESAQKIVVNFGSGIYGEPSREIVINDEQLAARFITLSQEAYDALTDKDPRAFYFTYED
ncbi:MAG: hypothetical protein IKH61_12760 [Bacteroidales bacterium]|nr:hypothetical protein [Bacteroidales bacterium]